MAVNLFVNDPKSSVADRDPVGARGGQKRPFPVTESDIQQAMQKTREIESTSIAGDGGRLDSNSTDEIRRVAVEQVSGRIRWKPSNLFEEEIRQVAIERAECLLQEKKEE